jgi:hypothetical protein
MTRHCNLATTTRLKHDFFHNINLTDTVDAGSGAARWHRIWNGERSILARLEPIPDFHCRFHNQPATQQNRRQAGNPCRSVADSEH